MLILDACCCGLLTASSHGTACCFPVPPWPLSQHRHSQGDREVQEPCAAVWPWTCGCSVSSLHTAPASPQHCCSDAEVLLLFSRIAALYLNLFPTCMFQPTLLEATASAGVSQLFGHPDHPDLATKRCFYVTRRWWTQESAVRSVRQLMYRRRMPALMIPT
jgi:hypothetical protein